MSSSVTRRDFLRSAGGITFLALTPIGHSAFAAPVIDGTARLPPFTVLPYIQPDEHYEVQHMRVLSPLLEAHGVDFVLSGHEHNYQRPRPLTFVPAGLGKSGAIAAKDRRVPGTFTIDTTFDGIQHTRPKGILYIVTGAGGKHRYDAGYTDFPARWKHADDGNVDYVVKMITDRHSLTVFEIDGKSLSMVQIDETGHEIDRINVTKA